MGDIFNGASRSPTRTHKEDARDNVFGIETLFVSLYSILIPYSFSHKTKCANNIAEYEAVTVWLELTLQIPVTSLTIYHDSEL